MPNNADSALVDANIFLRYLTGDIPEQARKARTLLERAERGEEALVTTALTIAEIIWFLESVYELDRPSIRAKVVAILGLPGLTVEDQNVLLQAIVWYEEKNVDFADCYIAAWMEHHGLEEVYTYDTDFNRFEGLTPLEPG
ncbi:PIN domain-containing protein [Salinibacter sp.]|uniref:PIN domain-containing protein n=1 Tax=Salinibacter sp. TaxID=2065818 RepID=UPI0021E6ECDB|nr:PIN domain-containing protein [Salinibacter sp.]